MSLANTLGASVDVSATEHDLFALGHLSACGGGSSLSRHPRRLPRDPRQPLSGRALPFVWVRQKQQCTNFHRRDRCRIVKDAHDLLQPCPNVGFATTYDGTNVVVARCATQYSNCSFFLRDGRLELGDFIIFHFCHAPFRPDVVVLDDCLFFASRSRQRLTPLPPQRPRAQHSTLGDPRCRAIFPLDTILSHAATPSFSQYTDDLALFFLGAPGSGETELHQIGSERVCDVE